MEIIIKLVKIVKLYYVFYINLKYKKGAIKWIKIFLKKHEF